MVNFILILIISVVLGIVIFGLVYFSMTVCKAIMETSVYFFRDLKNNKKKPKWPEWLPDPKSDGWQRSSSSNDSRYDRYSIPGVIEFNQKLDYLTFVHKTKKNHIYIHYTSCSWIKPYCKAVRKSRNWSKTFYTDEVAEQLAKEALYSNA